jgi:hypothetical protein
LGVIRDNWWEFAKGFVIDGAAGGIVAAWDIVRDLPGFFDSLRDTLNMIVYDPGGFFSGVVDQFLASLTDPRALGALTFDAVVAATGVGAAYMGAKNAGKIMKFANEVMKAIPDGLVQKARSAFRKGPGNWCFVAGTTVLTECGHVPIEDVAVGELVYSRDEATGESGYQRVLATFVTPNMPVWDVEFEECNGATEIVSATFGHPFWVEGVGWTSTEDLVVGMVVQTVDGQGATVKDLELAADRQSVYNFEVSNTHTYFVGRSELWVHNPKRCTPEGFQDHHIISDKNPLTKDHELIDLAEFDLQSATNRIFLPTEPGLHPTRSIHSGRHYSEVSRDLARQMDEAVMVGKQHNFSVQQYNKALRELISAERQELRSGRRRLNKNSRNGIDK